MGMYIKGIEMPLLYKTYKVRFAETNGGKIAVGIANENSTAYRPVGEAVHVPPHGDLIDRDDLSESLKRLCDRVCQYSKAQRKTMCGACPLGDAFAVVEDDAPPVIEAEVSE